MTNSPPAPAPAPAAAPAPALAARATPAPPGWLRRTWPPLTGFAPAVAVVGVIAVGLIAAWVLVFDRPGIGWLLVGLAATGTAVATRRAGTFRRGGGNSESRGREAEQIAWGLASVALLGVGAVRADGGLYAWCVCAALACGSVGLAGGRTVRGVTVGSVAIIFAALRAFRWWRRGLVRLRPRASNGFRLGRTIAISVGLLVVFGVLFTSADPAFAQILTHAIPKPNPGETGRAIVALLLAGSVAAGLAYLSAGPPPFHDLEPVAARTVRRAEWAVPLTILDLLFLAFVLVQLASLFGGRQRVLRTAGLTYAQYARSGFWQLLVVAGLTLIVIFVASRVAPRTSSADRVLIRVLLGVLSVLTLVIVASALQRLSVYDSAYGYTRLRLAVGVTEVWLGAVFVFVLVAGMTLRAVWLPRAAAASAVCALLVTAVIGPDQFIANKDVDRYQRTGQIDAGYLSGLSADAVPALSRLPQSWRDLVLSRVECQLTEEPDDWRSWNAGRSRALELFGSPSLAATRCEG